MSINLVTGITTTNPGQLNSNVAALLIATQLDEQNFLAVNEYTAAGAIAVQGGKAFLKAGSAAAMTLGAPVAGSQLNGGNDGLSLKIVALDAYAYTVTCAANSINGNKDTATWTAAIGNALTLEAFGGVWIASGLNGVALSEV
jgi:hypothetical protein